MNDTPGGMDPVRLRPYLEGVERAGHRNRLDPRVARVEGHLAGLEMKVARLHLRGDLTPRNRYHQIDKVRKKLVKFYDVLDQLKNPQA